MKVIPSGDSLGATIEGVDLARPLATEELGGVLQTLGKYGVLRFPRQQLTGRQLRDFSAQLGDLEINVGSAGYQEPGVPEVMILSNVVENGRPIGLADAGQGWHTDMSYSRMIAFANVLYGLKIPRRNGTTLGATQFANTQAAYADLPADVKRTLEGKTVLHDFEKFWEMMRRRGGAASSRLPLTDAQRRQKPPVSHPLVMVHPISGRKSLYADPGYTVRIDGMPEAESEELLQSLFRHQLQSRFQYTHRWSEGDVVVWDNLWTLHNAEADYRADEPRLIRRCQAMANLVFTPAFADLAQAAKAK
jgi:taurine dioxygenase